MTQPRVMLLAGRGRSSRIVAATLDAAFDLAAVVVEAPISRALLVRRRAERLGWATVADQLGFQGLISPALSLASRRRIDALLEEHGWRDLRMREDLVTHVPSINDERVDDILRTVRPDVVVINGTRIVAKRVLQAIDAPFVNVHAGITPRYRGVHGGYWALADQRADLCGVTVHLVDPGIDTGGVLAQGTIQPTDDDTFATYPLLQLATGLPLLVESVRRLAGGDRTTVSPLADQSKLRHHPRASEYLFRWWKLGVR